MDTSQYLDMFIGETEDNLQSLNEYLLSLEENPKNLTKINEIFRVAHTLKGMSATMGFNNMAELTHTMEDVLSEFREGKLDISQDILTILFKCLDILEQMKNSIAAGENDSYDSLNIITLELKNIIHSECKGVLEKRNQAALDNISFNEYDLNVLINAKKDNYNIFNINIEIDEKTILKSARIFLVVKYLEDSGEIIKTVPDTESLENEEFDLDVKMVYLTKESKEKIKETILNISEIKNVIINELDLKDNVKTLQASSEPKNKNIIEDASVKQKNTFNKKLHQTVRVDLERIDKFMNLVSELVIDRTRLEQINLSEENKNLKEIIEQMGRITNDLQDLVMQIRMMPLSTVFSRFPRMIRDLSVELNKNIRLVIEGEETELDRTVIDEIGEPLIHLLRNSSDHGIESKEERLLKGKNEEGTIRLKAYQEGTNVIINIEDDGAGINIDKIKTKAAEKGIDTKNINEEDLKNLIFDQGFSTNDVITDVSGRGVGMDVVKSKITQLGGSVFLKSEKDKGTIFTIKLPLTLQIIQALLFKLGKDTYAIPLSYIDRIERYSQENIKYVNNEKVILYEGKIIPFISLKEKLNIKSILDTEPKETYILISKIGTKKVGLLVDSLIGQKEIVIKPLNKTYCNRKEFSGATVLGDGSLGLIFDINNIL